jgi:hypothetical protein
MNILQNNEHQFYGRSSLHDDKIELSILSSKRSIVQNNLSL